MKKKICGIFEKEGLFGKRGTKRGPLLAIFLKKSLRGTKNPKRDRLVITGCGFDDWRDHRSSKWL